MIKKTEEISSKEIKSWRMENITRELVVHKIKRKNKKEKFNVIIITI